MRRAGACARAGAWRRGPGRGVEDGKEFEVGHRSNIDERKSHKIRRKNVFPSFTLVTLDGGKAEGEPSTFEAYLQTKNAYVDAFWCMS